MMDVEENGNSYEKYIWYAGIALIVLLIIYLIYWLFNGNAIDGYWKGTEQFNAGLGVVYSIVYIKGDVFIWVLENTEGQVVAQSYEMKDDVGGRKLLTMVTGDGESVFNGPITFEMSDDKLKVMGSATAGPVKSEEAGTDILFEGVRTKI